MIDLDYYKLKAADESELTTKGFDIKLALRDLITDVEREMKANPVENRVMPKIADLAEDVQHYISIHWNGKQITPEIGLLHWLKIQEISNKLDKLKE